MRTTLKTFTLALFLIVLSSAHATLVTTDFGLTFAADQSLWAAGPSFGLSSSGRTPGSVGLYYDVNANSGTVTANVAGDMRAQYADRYTPTDNVGVTLSYLGGSASVTSAFGASAEAGVFLDVSGCIGVVVFGSCVGVPYNIDTDIGIIDDGFFLDPATGFTPLLNRTVSANAADQLAGVGSIDLVIGNLGPSMNLDLDQTITFTPTGVSGIILYENRVSGETGFSEFDIQSDGSVDVDFGALSFGVWDFVLMDVLLGNSFTNDVDLEVRPAFDYIVGSWPPAGNELFGFDLLDESFSLDFNRIDVLGSFSIQVVPVPAAIWLLVSALLGLAGLKRR